MPTSRFRFTAVDTDANGDGSPLSFSVVGGEGGETLADWLADDGATPLRAQTTSASTNDDSTYLLLSGLIERTSGKSNAEAIPADATITGVRILATGARVSGTFMYRLQSNVRLVDDGEAYDDLADQVSDQTNFSTSAPAEISVDLGDDSQVDGLHTLERLRSGDLAVWLRVTHQAAASVGELLGNVTLEVDWTPPPFVRPDPARGFRLGSTLQAGGGLSIAFARDADTVDPQGLAVAAGTHRTLRPQALSGLVTFAAVTLDDVAKGSTSALLPCIGADGSGARRLGWFVEGDAALVEVDKATGALTTLFESELGAKGTQAHAPDITPAGSKYATEADWALTPTNNARTAEGVVSVQCIGHFDTTGSDDWEARGTVIVESLDEGDTWTIVFDNTTDALDAGNNRGQQFALTGPFTPFRRSASNILEMWLCEADYMYHSPSGGTEGAVWARRYTRSAVGEVWTRSASIPFARSESANFHAHCAAIIEVPLASGRRVPAILAHYGDGAENATDLHVFDDGVSSYAEGGGVFPASDAELEDGDNWTTIAGWHGDSTAGAPTRGTQGTQEIGAIPSPTVGEIICASDAKQHWMHAWRAPDAFDLNDPAPPIIRVRSDRSFGDTAGKCFNIRCERPDGRAAVAEWEMHPSGDAGGRATRTHIYSDDGFVTGVPLAARRSETEFAAIGFGRIYVSGLGATNPGVVVASVPSVRKLRAALVGPGGVNRVAAHDLIAASLVGPNGDHEIAVIKRHSDGFFYDFDSVAGDQNGNAEYRLPAAPFLSDAILRVEVDGATQTPNVGRVRIAAAGDQTFADESILRRLRMWGLARSGGAGASITPRINDGAHGTELFRQANGHPTAYFMTANSRQDWMCLVGDAAYNMAGDDTRSLYIEALAGTSNDPQPTSFFLGWDNQLEGAGGAGWPMPPYTAEPVELPDERLTITGLDWKDLDAAEGGEGVRLVMQTSPHAWDAWSMNEGTGGEYILATIEHSETVYVQVIADTANLALIVRMVDGESSEDLDLLDGLIHWKRGTVIDIGLWRDTEAETLNAIAIVNGVMDEGTLDLAGLLGEVADTLRIGADAGEDGAVYDIACFGGEIVQAASYESFVEVFGGTLGALGSDRVALGRGRSRLGRRPLGGVR